MQRPAYKKVFAISQSALKAFRTKPLQKFKQIYIDGIDEDDDDDKRFTFGSLVDTVALSPKLLEERFFNPGENVEIPGEKVKQIIDMVYKEAHASYIETVTLNEKGNLPEKLHVKDITELREWEALILKYAKEVEYGGNSWSEERILKGVFSTGSIYFFLLGTAKGRIIISAAENVEAVEVNEKLRTDKETMPYFIQQEGEVLLHQQEIFVDYFHQRIANSMEELLHSGVFKQTSIVPLKGAVDIIRINEKDKTVQVADLKTTHTAEEFEKKARSYDYVIQASFYLHIVRAFLDQYKGGIYKDFSMLPPINIVIDKEYKIPYIYEYTWDDIEVAENGNFDFTGWKETLNEIVWHMDNGIWDRPKELYLNKKIILKIFK